MKKYSFLDLVFAMLWIPNYRQPGKTEVVSEKPKSDYYA
ncbi:hypothetical protein SAMN05216357_10536 [Porphyromonadaceae bacterium KH3CP3RA]|nr:hypothetical protein SAMN05216357_10536 [Porphyromonadaceae bacterium KH3CP3RA]